VNVDRIRKWLSNGAQPTEAVERILKWNGVVAPSSESPASALDESAAES
jgi:ribosomal protein S16